jgi:hypothetical protein
MPIANLTDTMLAAGADTLIEPIKKNQYRLYLQVGNLIGVLKSYFPEDNDYLVSIGAALTGNVYPIEIAFTPPSIQVEERKTKGTGNVEVRYAGYVTYGNAEATFHNFIDLDSYKFFYRWAALAGGLALVCQNDQILGTIPTRPLPVADFSPDNSTGYKINATVSTFHTRDPAVGDETENNHWVLQGVFPTAVSPGDLNHADDGEPILTTVSFAVDLALPAKGSFAPI